jgi:hypothetical protein
MGRATRSESRLGIVITLAGTGADQTAVQRISAKVRSETFDNGQWTLVSESTTTYLNDSHNFTGNTQVLEEIGRDANGVEQSRIVYTIGLMLVGQTTFDAQHPVGQTYLFGQDGHGSVRQFL